MKDYVLSHINKVDCERFKNGLRKINRSTRYKNDILAIYKVVFKYAFKYDYISSDPSSILEKIKKTYQEKAKKLDEEMNIWTLDDFSLFVQNVEGKCYECLFVILYFSGLRIGEAVALKWTDYNGASLFVNKSLTRKAKSSSYEIKEPKSPSSVRRVTLCDSVCDYLNLYKKNEEVKEGFSDSWFIFGGEYPLTENSITRHKNRAIKKVGVRRIRLHDFQHSHA